MLLPKVKKLYDIKYILSTRKPRLWLRVALNVIKVLLFEKKILRSVDFCPTYTCNLNCVHCFTENMKRKGVEVLNIEDYKRIASEAIKMGATHFAIQGGEPFIYPKLEELVKVLQPKKMFISITTNGTLLDESKARRLKKLGVDMITFSLDNVEPEKHNEFRGRKNSFRDTVGAIYLASYLGFKVTINTCVTHDYLQSNNLEEMIDWTKNEGFKLNIVLPVPVGRWEERYDILTTEEERKYVYKLLKKYSHIRRDLDSGYFKWGCGAGKEMLYVTPYGDVLVCPFIQASFGNVKEESLETIRKRALENSIFSEYVSCCLAAEDRNFIKKYLSKTWRKKTLPIKSCEMFGED